jgi:uncharacterized LabA/DUF88 family protein
MPACVYIDGFSLYHQCFRRTAERNHLKWLDLCALASANLPDEDIADVRYYTARVSATPEDPLRASRQDAFLRALATLPNLVIRQSQFSRSKRRSLGASSSWYRSRQMVWIMQEKRSDVSLATDLLVDAFDGRAEVALLITNDSDFERPIKVVTDRFEVRVVIISPDVMVSKRLAKLASHARPLDHRLLENCQLPDVVIDADGREIHRPGAWTRPA